MLGLMWLMKVKNHEQNVIKIPRYEAPEPSPSPLSFNFVISKIESLIPKEALKNFSEIIVALAGRLKLIFINSRKALAGMFEGSDSP